MTMQISELIEDLRSWDFSRGGPFHGHARAIACMKQAADEIEARQKALTRITLAFRPFTMKPMGGPGSMVRLEQQEQIEAHAEASALALSSHQGNCK